MGDILHYYAGNHTAKGFYSLYASNFQELDHVLFLEGESVSMKTRLMNELIKTCSEKEYDLEIIHSYDENYLDGFVLPQWKVGVYGGLSHVFQGNHASVKKITVDDIFHKEKLDNKTLHRLKNRRQRLLNSSHRSFQTGLRIHDGLEDIYINHMDFSKADHKADELADILFHSVEKKEKGPQYKHRFFGASTPKGVVDYIPNLTEKLKKRYFIKGRAGTGKSTFLKRIISVAEELGVDMEIYHCGFDPDSLDMVIFRDISVCIFDSTDPHEYFPERQEDEVIDLYTIAVMPGTDEKYEKEIQSLNRRYKSHMKKGIQHLKEAQDCTKKIEQLYIHAMNESSFMKKLKDLHQYITI